MSQADFDKMMNELRAEYIDSIPQKIADIQIHLSVGDVELLRNDFHKLKGTGKTYGIAEISEFGFVFEKLCLSKVDVSTFVPTAIEILSAIHQSRKQGQPFAIDQRDDYKKFKNMTA